LADNDAQGEGRDLDAARAAKQDVDTPPFLAARERGADASAAPPASGVATDTRAARGAPEAYAEGDEDYSDEPGERTERPGAFAALAGLGGLFRRDPRPRAGTPRPVRQADIDRGAPSWERPRRYEAYPTLKTRIRMPSMSPLLVALLALVVAAVALFTLPGIFLNSGSPGARSTPTLSAQSSGPASATPIPSPTPLTYTIAKGDTLARIANKFHITQAQLVAANPQIKDPNKIVLGDVLVIPRPSPSSISDTSSPSPSP
jgi:LysM repeat protein